ncbi:MAG: ABC transporter ATP-binding protein, partial [Actinomycetota bacterium]|nr:ABC transporter ATP-binding protein [Actinomycetota bacterium]
MESSPAVAVTGLSKSYRIAHHADAPVTATEALLARLRHPLTRMERETFDALHDVTFEIPWGSVVGLIGRNGAGKSTLLKILTRITAPSAGRVVMGGRVGSLLEIGTGFHPELTGRENVYLNGTLLGMRRTEIRRRFDEIVAFAGVERFLDTQVKRYSTGMYVRLAFAVAAHLESEVMAVDEVLAVGDADFQAKCLEKLREVAQGGRTVILVSHQAQTIADLCDSALYLERGRLRFQGPVDGALEEYRNSYRRIREAGLDASSRPGSGELRFTSVRSRRDLYGADEEKVIELEVSANPELAGRYWLVAHVLDDLGAIVAQ